MASASSKPSSAIRGRAPHRRNEAARKAILNAADDLLVERGFGGVTMEGIAARAGVAKQTIYRWWPSKVDILLDTLSEDAEHQLAIPAGGSAIANTRSYMRNLTRFVTKDPAGKVLLALLGQTQDSDAVAKAFNDRYFKPQRERERELLTRGIEAGELGPDIDVDAALDALCAPILMRALLGQSIPRRFLDGLIADTLEHHVR